MTTIDAPLRPDEAPGQRVRERRWWPPLAVASSIVVLVVLAHTLAGAGSAPTAVGLDGVRLRPGPGWDLEGSQPGWVRLHRGPVVLDVVVTEPVSTGAVGVAASYVDGILRPGLAQLSVGEPAPTTVAGGVPAVQVGYVGVTRDGVAIEGVVVAASGARRAVVFDIAAPEGALAPVADDVREMLDGAEVAP